MLLSHDELGEGMPVVLLHAGVVDRRMWGEHLAAIAGAGHRVIAMDLPGFGEAAVAQEQAPWADVLETMDALNVDGAALVGNSFGGAVALRVAVISPERVIALALVSAPAPEFEPSTEMQAAWDREESALERGDIEAAVDAVVETWTLPDAPAALRHRVAAMQRRAFEVQAAAGTPSEVPDPIDEPAVALARLAIPALVAVGQFDMSDFHAAADALAQLLPSARHTVIAGAGHLAPLEQPDAFRALLLDFLRSLRADHPAD
jgi:pimeloyl-ACP methyl ester carboxylesterase